MHLAFSRRLLLSTAVALTAIVAGAHTLTGRDSSSSGTYGWRIGAVRLQSAGVMQFGPDGTLFVAVDSNVWLSEIVRYRRKEILDRLQHSFGRDYIGKISFRVG